MPTVFSCCVFRSRSRFAANGKLRGSGSCGSFFDARYVQVLLTALAGKWSLPVLGFEAVSMLALRGKSEVPALAFTKCFSGLPGNWPRAGIFRLVRAWRRSITCKEPLPKYRRVEILATAAAKAGIGRKLPSRRRKFCWPPGWGRAHMLPRSAGMSTFGLPVRTAVNSGVDVGVFLRYGVKMPEQKCFSVPRAKAASAEILNKRGMFTAGWQGLCFSLAFLFCRSSAPPKWEVRATCQVVGRW